MAADLESYVWVQDPGHGATLGIRHGSGLYAGCGVVGRWWLGWAGVGKAIEILQSNVASLEPNPWGIYDMHGNLWEYVWDYYTRDLTKYGTIDPRGPPVDEALHFDGHVRRQVRGGMFKGPGQWARSAERANKLSAADTLAKFGFRVVLDSPTSGDGPSR